MLALLKKHRENLHRIPEMGYKELKTKAYIMENLEGLSCELYEPDSTAICAFFKVNDGNAIALRCDMDALPNKEKTGLSYASEHDNLMHSCGHDGHMAMVLGIAAEIEENLNRLHTNVVLIFQPAEEGGSGAEKLCQTGILKELKVNKIFGFHLWPGIKKHTIASMPGGILARSTEMNIIVTGKPAHVADSDSGIDALYIGCKFLCSLYETIETEIPKEELRLLKFGRADSGIVRNSISDITVFEGTMRCFSPDLFDFMLEKIYEVSQTFEDEYGCIIQTFYNKGYPPVLNDAALFDETREILSGDFTFETLTKPYLQAEDFSFYQQRMPGCFLLLGVGDTPPLHSNTFQFDEEVLVTGVMAYKALIGI